jgi:hypothetical protein
MTAATSATGGAVESMPATRVRAANARTIGPEICLNGPAILGNTQKSETKAHVYNPSRNGPWRLSLRGLLAARIAALYPGHCDRHPADSTRLAVFGTEACQMNPPLSSALTEYVRINQVHAVGCTAEGRVGRAHSRKVADSARDLKKSSARIETSADRTTVLAADSAPPSPRPQLPKRASARVARLRSAAVPPSQTTRPRLCRCAGSRRPIRQESADAGD